MSGSLDAFLKGGNPEDGNPAPPSPRRHARRPRPRPTAAAVAPRTSRPLPPRPRRRPSRTTTRSRARRSRASRSSRAAPTRRNGRSARTGSSGPAAPRPSGTCSRSSWRKRSKAPPPATRRRSVGADRPGARSRGLHKADARRGAERAPEHVGNAGAGEARQGSRSTPRPSTSRSEREADPRLWNELYSKPHPYQWMIDNNADGAAARGNRHRSGGV